MAEETPSDAKWFEVANEKVDEISAALEGLNHFLGLRRIDREIVRARGGEMEYVINELRAISSVSKSLAERYGGEA
jgi:hypothetical protein